MGKQLSRGSEETTTASNELKRALGDVFPLVPPSDLPCHPSQIPTFLKNRIRFEVSDQTQGFVTEVGRILLEATHPQQHMQDMARAVVERAKAFDALAASILADVAANIELYRNMNGDSPVSAAALVRYLESMRDRVIRAEEDLR